MDEHVDVDGDFAINDLSEIVCQKPSLQGRGTLGLLDVQNACVDEVGMRSGEAMVKLRHDVDLCVSRLSIVDRQSRVDGQQRCSREISNSISIVEHDAQ